VATRPICEDASADRNRAGKRQDPSSNPSEIDNGERNIPLKYFEKSSRFDGLRGKERVPANAVDWRHS
jgi:hypothetical protein